jgi:hypothetical protein
VGLVKLFLLLVIFVSSVSAEAAEFQWKDSDLDIDNWGLEVAFSSQSYMEENDRLSFFSPHLFGGWYDSSFRLTLDWITRKLENSSSGRFGELTLSIEENSRIYKDIAYSYLRLGVSQMFIDDRFYDGPVLSVPAVFGGHFVVANSTQGVISYFVEYRFTVFTDYTESESLPGVAATLPKGTFFSEAIAMGIRYIF